MSARNPIERQLLKLAAECYDLAVERGEHFTVADLGDSLATDLVARFDRDGSITRDLIGMTAHHLVAAVDRERTKPVPEATLFDDLDRVVPVDAGQRIARRHMDTRDWSAHLANVSANAARVNASAAKENTRFAALAPYLSTGLATGEAVAAWVADNPDQILP